MPKLRPVEIENAMIADHLENDEELDELIADHLEADWERYQDTPDDDFSEFDEWC